MKKHVRMFLLDLRCQWGDGQKFYPTLRPEWQLDENLRFVKT